MTEPDPETRLQQLENGWQDLSTDQQRGAVAELESLSAGLSDGPDGPLAHRIEALRADLVLTIGLQPPTAEQGFKG